MMSNDNRDYHRTRAEHCLAMANQSPDPEVRRRHEELAALHASRAAAAAMPVPNGELSAA